MTKKYFPISNSARFILLILSKSCYWADYSNNFTDGCVYSTNITVSAGWFRRRHYCFASSKTVIYFTSFTMTRSLICPAMSSTAKQSLIGPDSIVISQHFWVNNWMWGHMIRRVSRLRELGREEWKMDLMEVDRDSVHFTKEPPHSFHS